MSSKRLSDGNWAPVFRSIVDGPIGADDALLGLWLRLRVLVRYRARYWNGHRIAPGQMILADRKMQEFLYPAAESPPSCNTIKKRLKQLEGYGAISIKIVTNPKGRLITVNDGGDEDIASASKIDATSGADVGATSGADVGANRRRDNTKLQKLDNEQPSTTTAPLCGEWLELRDFLFSVLKMTEATNATIAARDDGWSPDGVRELIRCNSNVSPGLLCKWLNRDPGRPWGPHEAEEHFRNRKAREAVDERVQRINRIRQEVKASGMKRKVERWKIDAACCRALTEAGFEAETTADERAARKRFETENSSVMAP